MSPTYAQLSKYIWKVTSSIYQAYEGFGQYQQRHTHEKIIERARGRQLHSSFNKKSADTGQDTN